MAMNIFKRLFDNSPPIKREHVYGATDTGLRRPKNEDFYRLIPDKGLYIVADGMGGHNAGEVASSNAVSMLCDYFDDNLIKKMRKEQDTIEYEMSNSIQIAHNNIIKLSRTRSDYRGMGTTVVVALVQFPYIHICHVGDSRAYKINEKGIFQLTDDHSSVWDMVKTGELTQEEARKSPYRSQISQAIGAPFVIKPEYNRERLSRSDKIMMCSDGLWDMLSDEEIKSLVDGGGTLENIGANLIKYANDAGGDDNITVVIIDCKYI